MLAGARHAFERVYKPVWRQWLIAQGDDVTAEHASRSCIVYAPHPDDETLGCGGLIARKRAEGTSVRVVVASTGARSHVTGSDLDLAKVRAGELREACRILGVEPCDIEQLGLPDGELGRFEDELVDHIADEIDRCRPDDVLVTTPRDWHPDHQALGRAVHRAAARAQWAPRLLEYPIWWWVDGPWRRRESRGRWSFGASYAADTVAGFSEPSVHLVEAAPYLATKRRAIAAHRSQLQALEADSEWVVLDGAMRAALTGRYELLLPVDVAPTTASDEVPARRPTTSS
jgi:LmbE family N-acetylglucosaminyl deacetylase